jgi:DNA processing protein
LDSVKSNFFSKIKTLLSINGLGIMKILKLVDLFGSIDNLFTSSSTYQQNKNQLSSHLASKLLLAQQKHEECGSLYETEIEKMDALGIKTITFWNKEYPQPLKNIYYPPLLLYIYGKIENIDSQSISVVGTRKATDYGKTITNEFVKSLVQQNITIVSGMARGIDSIAHKTAIKNGGKTIAIIGSGLDVIYPPENRNLFKEISENGAVISEFPLGTKPDAQNFPKRNRIIAGISLGTLVVETRENGGAMQTAKFALDQNKEVFAIPGNLTSQQSIGTNSLIQQNGAKLVKSADDILIELQLKLKPQIGINIPQPKIDLSLFEEKIFNTLDSTPKQIDKISKESMLSISDSLINLLSLEFKGVVQQLPGKMFKRI